jgi:hypothetical protein
MGSGSQQQGLGLVLAPTILQISRWSEYNSSNFSTPEEEDAGLGLEFSKPQANDWQNRGYS